MHELHAQERIAVVAYEVAHGFQSARAFADGNEDDPSLHGRTLSRRGRSAVANTPPMMRT